MSFPARNLTNTASSLKPALVWSLAGSWCCPPPTMAKPVTPRPAWWVSSGFPVPLPTGHSRDPPSMYPRAVKALGYVLPGQPPDAGLISLGRSADTVLAYWPRIGFISTVMGVATIEAS